MSAAWHVNTEASNNEGSALRSFLLRGAVWSAGGRLLSMVGNLALGVVLARSLAPADYGRFYLALTAVVIFASAASFGMDQIVVRAVAESATRPVAGRMIRRCLVVAMLGALLAGGAILAFDGFVALDGPFGSKAMFWTVLLWAAVGTVQMQLAESFRALGDIKGANIFGGVKSAGIINAVLPPVAMLCLWKLGWLSLSAAVLLMLASSVLISVVAYLRLDQGGVHTSCMPSAAESLRTLLRAGVPVWLAAMITVLYSQGFLWFSSLTESDHEVALLAAAQRTVLVLIAPTAIVSAVLPPVIARLWASGNAAGLQRTVQTVAAIATLASVSLLGCVLAAGPNLLQFMFGDYFGAAFSALMVLSIANTFHVATGSWQIVLALTGHGKDLFWISLMGLAMFLCLMPTVSSYPVTGISVAWAMSTIVMNVVGTVVTRRRTGAWTYAKFSWVEFRAASRSIASGFAARVKGARA